MIPASAYSFGAAAMRYAATASVAALVKRLEHEIAHLSPSEIGRYLSKLLPGKKNAGKRNAVKQALTLSVRPGFGSTKTAALAYDVGVSGMEPRFKSAKGSYVVANREFVSDIRGFQDFGTLEINAQPGLASMFPWLSRIANTHQKYKFRRLKFSYVPIAGASAPGRVTMAFATDVLDPPVDDKQQLFQYHNSTEGSVWAANHLTLSKELNGSLFTRGGAVENTDLKTYDLGRFIIATSNCTDTSVIGELFVDYEVELSIPAPAFCPSSQYFLSSAGGNIDINDMLPTHQPGIVEQPGADWFLRKGVDNSTTLVFRSVGTVLLSWFITGTNVATMNLVRTNTAALTIELTRATEIDTNARMLQAVCQIKQVRDSSGAEVGIIFTPGGGSFTAITSVEITVAEFDLSNRRAIALA